MRKLLEQLYNGQLIPVEQIVSNDPAYRAVNQQITETMKVWQKRLDGADYEDLEQLLDLFSQLEEVGMLSAFVYGFQLGVSLTLESATSLKDAE